MILDNISLSPTFFSLKNTSHNVIRFHLNFWSTENLSFIAGVNTWLLVRSNAWELESSELYQGTQHYKDLEFCQKCSAVGLILNTLLGVSIFWCFRRYLDETLSIVFDVLFQSRAVRRVIYRHLECAGKPMERVAYCLIKWSRGFLCQIFFFSRSFFLPRLSTSGKSLALVENDNYFRFLLFWRFVWGFKMI